MDRDADFGAYVVARREALVRAAVLLGCSTTEAEDVTQTALSQCYRAWDRVRSVNDPDAYVYRVLTNALARSRRRLWWGERPTDPLPVEATRDDEAELTAVAQTVRAALARLSDEQRTVLVLRFFVDLSERQVAEALAIPAGTVKSRAARGLAALAVDPDVIVLTEDRRS